MSSDEHCIEILEPDLCSICEDSNIVTIVICHLSPNGKHNGYYVCDECNRQWALRSNRCIICNEELNIEDTSSSSTLSLPIIIRRRQRPYQIPIRNQHRRVRIFFFMLILISVIFLLLIIIRSGLL
jgi:hypothetical protein